MTNLDPDFRRIADPVLAHREIRKLAGINHHGNSILDHSLKVAVLAWRLSSFLRLDRRSAVRGALLHDFFLYDWKTQPPHPDRKFHEFRKMHGFTHPREALRNGERHFNLNPVEKDIIKRHMFPLTLIPPRYPESWIVTICDKWVAFREIPQYLRHILVKSSSQEIE